MAHENSETIERDGRWYNVYGEKASKPRGTPLKKKYAFEEHSYATRERAEDAAKWRSYTVGMENSPRPQSRDKQSKVQEAIRNADPMLFLAKILGLPPVQHRPLADVKKSAKAAYAHFADKSNPFRKLRQR